MLMNTGRNGLAGSGDRLWRRNEVGICIGTGIASIVIFCMVSHIWNMDLNVPLSYSGDVSGLLIMIKSVLREESWWHFGGLGAPFHTNRWRMMMDGSLPNAIMFSIAKITKSVGYGINLYYILSYGLSGICTYYMLRKAEVQIKFSVVGAVLYALIPGHYQRGEGHIYVGSCFAIPLIIVSAMNLFSGKMCKPEYASREKLTAKELAASAGREQKFGLLFLMMVSFCTIYYGVFSLMLLTFCAVYCSIMKRQWRHLYYYLQFVFVEIICVLFIYLPQVIADRWDPLAEKVNIVTRALQDVEFYGGKMIQYILPVAGHRLAPLARLRQLYDATFPLNNENGMASLGIVMTIGFLAALLALFFSKEKCLEQYETYGKIELFLFLMSTIGGLGVIVGFINYNLRCYNRFSYFVGAVAMIVSMRLLQNFCLWMQNKRNASVLVSYLLCLLVLGLGIFDQTSAGMKYTRKIGESVEAEYHNDEKFVNQIENLDKKAKILVFPIMNGQQAAVGTTSEGVFTDYNDQLLFLHSNASSWSTGGQPGDAGERWLNWLQKFDAETQVEVAAIAGFSGIAVYYGGYEAERLNLLLSKLEETAGPPAIVHESGTWAYYSLGHVCKMIMGKYSAEKLEELKNKYLYEYSSWVAEYNVDNLYTTSAVETPDEITLTKGTCQYGPYNTFQAGLYSVEIYGSNLDDAEFDCYCNTGDRFFEIALEEVRNDYVRYSVRFVTDTDLIEFRTHNESDSEVTVKKIEVNKAKQE